MSEVDKYLSKELTFSICKFILERRIDEDGIGNPIEIKIEDMEPLLFCAHGNNMQEDIDELGKRLLFLNSETFGESMNRSVIKITDTSLLNKLSEHFGKGRSIKIVCSSENIEDYIDTLKRRTDALLRNLGMGRIDILPNGAIMLKIGDKEMKVTRSKNNDKNVSIYVTRLMFGEVIESNYGNVSIEDYKRGDHIFSDELIKCLKKIWGESVDEITTQDRKLLNGVVSELNQRASKELGFSMYEINDQGLKLCM